MINGLVALFGRSQLPFFLVGLAVLFIFIALASVRDNGIPRKRGFDHSFLFVAGLTILVWRWPTFLWQNPMNPDEGLWVAAAMKVTVDWVPWRGFDLGTNGPLSAYVLALPALLGRRIDFFSTRLLGVCLLTLTTAGLFYTVKWLSTPRVARLAVIPSVLLLALTNDWNFLHFSSEVVPLFLTTTALAAGAYLVNEQRPPWHRFAAIALAGLCLGSTGFAKIQSLPIALSILIFVLAVVYLKQRPPRKRAVFEGLTLVASLSVIPAVMATVLSVTGGWNYLLQTSVKGTASYVAQGKPLSLAFLFEMSPSYAAFLVPSLILLFVTAEVIAYQRHSVWSRPSWLGVASLLLILGAGCAIFIPHREFVHYLLFSIVPLSCCLASILNFTGQSKWWNGREKFLTSTYIGVFLIPALAVAMSSPPNRFLNEMVFNSTWIGSNQAKAIGRYALPGDRIAIWGLRPEFFVQTRTIMATRYPELFPVVGPLRDFYEQNMMGDLHDHVPRVFVDAVTRDSFQYNNPSKNGHESFPALASFVKERFILREEVDGVRIFSLKTD